METDVEQELRNLVKDSFKSTETRTESPQSDLLTADQVADIIKSHGTEALPIDIFRRMAPGEEQRLGKLAFYIYQEVIASKGGQAADLWFVPSPLIHSSIPTTNPGTITQYLSCAGNFETTISVPLAKHPRDQISIPYGIPGRQALALLATLCLSHQDEERVYVPGAKRKFIESIFDLKPTSGARGNVTRYTESMISWLNASIHIVQRTVKEEGGVSLPFTSVEPMSIVKRAVYWGSSDFRRTEGCWFEFSDYFKKLCAEHSVPIDRETQLRICSLDDALAYDLYHWALWRTKVMGNRHQDVIRLTWSQFLEQFLPHYKSPYSASDTCLKSLDLLTANGFKLPMLADKRNGLLLFGQHSKIAGAVPSQQASLF